MSDLFDRGPYDEILPPPLIHGATPDEAIAQLATAVKQQSGVEMDQPRSGRSGEGLRRLSAAYVHAQNLLKALRGELWTADAIALRVFVEQGGEPVSLRPLYLEDLHFQSFIPIFQREGQNNQCWRIGLPDQGKSKVIEGSCAEAFTQAQATYAEWAAQEEEKLNDWLKKKIAGAPTNVYVICWQMQLTQSGQATLQAGCRLEHWGKHATYALITPKGLRILRTSSDELAARYAYTIMSKRLPPPPTPQQVVDALLTGAPRPEKAGDQWRVNGAVVAFHTAARASARHKQNQYDMTLRGNTVHVVKNGRKFRQLTFPGEGEWSDAGARRRVLLGWIGLLTAEK
jgi:hypothetical protein